MYTNKHITAHKRQKPFFPKHTLQMKGQPGTGNSMGQEKEAIVQQAAVSNTGHVGLPNSIRTTMESMSGYPLDDVHLHYNSSAPQRMNALAYAQGTDIYVGPGHEEHVPHEAWHVVQQKQGRVPATSYANGALINESPALENEADEMGAMAIQMKTADEKQCGGHESGCSCPACAQERGVMQLKSGKGGVIQFVRPSYIVSHNFLGVNIPVSRGVHPTMRDRLILVETHLQSQYDALPAASRPTTLREYAGLDTIKGWRETTSKHGTGEAVDVNYDPQPYIATRTTEGGTTTYGGEQSGATAETRAFRRPAVEVYDRAVSFMQTNPYDSDVAEVGNRQEGESATAAYRRFRAVSNALETYLALAFQTSHERVNRVPVNAPETIPEADLLAAIPTSERKDETTAVADIQALMDDVFWQVLHPGYPLSAREQYIRILRDYEIVRRPMQYGSPSVSPASTRNPARGFLHLPEHFVVAMMDIGRLRWGACEFSARSNGDVHHFDLGTPYHSPAPVAATADSSVE